jgi:hypothetical protein
MPLTASPPSPSAAIWTNNAHTAPAMVNGTARSTLSATAQSAVFAIGAVGVVGLRRAMIWCLRMTLSCQPMAIRNGWCGWIQQTTPIRCICFGSLMEPTQSLCGGLAGGWGAADAHCLGQSGMFEPAGISDGEAMAFFERVYRSGIAIMKATLGLR